MEKLTLEEVATRIDERLTRSALEDRFSGAVLVADRNGSFFTSAYGFADRENEIATTCETRFRLGSLTKMFTGVGILQLESSGRLQLDAPLAAYEPEYPNGSFASAVTIRQLLTHTGGAGDIFGPEFEAHRAELREVGDYLSLFGHRGPDFEPGSRFAYSNYGYVLLGHVIERISGQSYDDYMSSNIFRPAGMERTGSEPENVIVVDRASGYMRTPEGWGNALQTFPFRGTPAGGSYSTVGDLLKFANALRDGRLLDARRVSDATAGQVEMMLGVRYGFGFMNTSEASAHFFGNSGGARGMAAELRIYCDNSYVIVVLTNRDPPAAKIIATFITTLLP